MKKAVVFLCNEPQIGTLSFAIEIALEGQFEVFLVIDNCDAYYGKEYRGVNIIQIKDEFTSLKGYYGCNIDGKSTHVKKEVIAWDKFLFSFCETLDSFDFVWVFEDDVFIPSIETINNLDAKYGHYDLVTPNNFEKKDKLMDWHWRHGFESIDPPHYYSMVCACGVSRNLLNEIKKYKEAKGKLFHIEIMFNTLAMQAGLNVADPLELKSVVWMGEWGLDEFLLLPDNVFHPKKDIENHESLRKAIAIYQLSDYVPQNKLPEFITNLLQNK